MHQSQNMDPNQQYWAEGDNTESNIGVFKTGEKLSFWELFKKHKVSVMVDCLVFGIFGMGVAFLGPTLFDLGCQTNSDLKKMNWVFFVQLLMTMIGSISAGYLTGRYVYYNIFSIQTLCSYNVGLSVCFRNLLRFKLPNRFKRIPTTYIWYN